jgi:hypothetical protein
MARINADMTIKGHEAMGIKLTPRAFMEICLAENARRYGPLRRAPAAPAIHAAHGAALALPS